MLSNLKKIRQELSPLYPSNEIEGIIRIIFDHLKNWSPVDIVLHRDDILSDYITEKIDSILSRLKQHEPIQYIIGEGRFFGRTFKVTPDTLIPRQETEELVEMIIKDFANIDDLQVFDVGTGSGCIAISLAFNLPFSIVTGIDISLKAIEIASENAKSMKAHRVSFHTADIFTLLPQQDSLDIIVSNPPYIPTEDCLHLQQEVMQEPAMALDGGQDGYDFYRRIAHEAPAYLNPDGSVWLEVGFDQAPTVMALLKDAGFAYVASHEDYQHIARMVEGCLSPEET